MDACWQQRLCLSYWSYIFLSIIIIIPFFLFSFYQRSYFLNFFPVWTFMHEKLFYDQSHHFQLEYRQQSIFLAYCCPFSFCINYHQSKASYLLFITIFTHFALNITILFIVLSLISVLCFTDILFIPLPCRPHHPSHMFYGYGTHFPIGGGECMHYGIACDMITTLCHTLLIWQHSSIACIHKFF